MLMAEDSSSLSEEEIPDSTCEKKKENENSWEEDSSSSSDSSPDEEASQSDRNQLAENKLTVKRDSSSSGSGSSSDEESGSDNKNRYGKTKNKKKEDRKVWEDNPDIYGIRRSSRPRKEPERLVVQSESDDSGDKKGRGRKGGRSRNDSWIPTLSGSDSEESDSSFDVPQKRQQKRIFKKQGVTRRKQQRGRAISTSSDEYSKQRTKRTISRNTNNKVSYKEDTEDETDSDDIIEQDESAAVPDLDVETIEKIMRHRQGRPGNIGARTTVYAEEAEELSRLAEPDPEREKTELQFLIKWKSWSHLHNTWETKDSLVAQNAAGMKKFENYVKRMEEIQQWKNISSPEDVEYFELQVEMNEDIQKQYQKVERIIAHQFTGETNSSYPDYLCKWQGLPYSESTWEDGSLTARFFQSEIDLYLERERSDTIPNKNAKCLRHRPKFLPFKKQPSYLGSEDLQLRDYQLDGLNWLAHAWCRELSIILADEMGLGKTIQTISFLSCLFHTHNLYGPFLAVVPLSTLDAWQREFQLWGSDMNVIVYIGDVNSRTKIQEYEWCFKKTRKLKFNVLLTTYEMLLRDKELLGSLNWAVLLIDEAHRLKNEDSLLYRSLVDFKTNFRLLITGTPLQNSLKELWSLMHFIMPNKFSDWGEFESQYSISDKEGLQKLHRDLEPFLLRRVKKDVEKSLPAKVEQILRMEMSTAQKQYYKLILTKNVKELCKELKGSFSGLLNIIVELKKCCNHANLIKPLDAVVSENTNLLQTLIKGSGKMILLDKLLSRLKETGHRVLIFSQMVRMLDIIADYLHLKRFAYQRLDGSIRGELRKRALDHFNAEGSQDFCFLLSTRAGGLGINLASADTVIIFDSDWNPQNDLQAMARAHRIGQKNQVNIYRFVTKNTIEEDIIERAKRKMVLDHLIIQRMDTTGRRILSKSTAAPSTNTPFNKEELSSILKFGAEDLFKETDQDTDQMLHAMDIDEILLRAETQEANEGPSVGEELLSQFKVVNYAAFNEEEIAVEKPNPMQKLWEEIIPEEDRKRVEEELEKEKKAELTLKPRSRKAVEKMNISLPSKKVKSKAIVDTDSSSSSDSDAPDNENAKDKKQPKKKTKPTAFSKEGVKGFTDNDVRRFVKSYKKFARPMTRLDSIAEDAELTDKSVTELKELAELLKSTCEQAVKEYQEKLLQDEQFDGKKKGASVKISGVTINAPSVLKAESDLEPLTSCLPTELKQQKNFRLTTPTRSVHWGIHWGVVEDSMLLVGMLIYGIGNWDAVKNDHSLGLTSKILPVGNGKPQKKHLQSRAEYLLKLLKEQNDHQNTDSSKKKSGKSGKRVKHKGKGDEYKSPVAETDQSKATNVLKIQKDYKTDKKEKTKKNTDKKKEKMKKSEKGALTDRVTSPLIHEDNVSITDLREDMSEETFKKCKEKMRPEKKSLQLLHTPDEKATSQEQVQTTKSCLLKIGDHIERCLDDYNNTPSALDSWRSNLWSFVAKFTELGPAKLYKLYRTAFRKRDVQLDEKKKEMLKLKASHSSTLHEMGKVLPPDRVELDEARKRALGMNKESMVPKLPKLSKIKIPHKEKSSMNNNDKGYADRSRHQDRRGGDDARQSHLKPPSRNSKAIDPSESSEMGDSFQTYKEWKEARSKRKMQGVVADEKPPQKENKHHHRDKLFNRDKPMYSDEKRISKHDQYPSFDSRNRPRYQKDTDYSISPSYRKSPSASQSPNYYGDRKRNSSNNSDLYVPSKRHHRDADHTSNSNQSWTGNT